MKATEVFDYLKRIKLADQVHFRENGQIVFYHWNIGMTDLVPSLTLENGRIEKIYYPRKVMPWIYIITTNTIENDFTTQEFLRDYRRKD